MILVLFLMLLSAMTRTENQMTLLRSWERLHLWQESVSGITQLVPMLKKVTREESAVWLLWLMLLRLEGSCPGGFSRETGRMATQTAAGRQQKLMPGKMLLG